MITYDQLRDALIGMAAEKSEWAGLPMPLPDMELVIEPKYPYQFGQFNKKPDDDGEDVEPINRWWSTRYRCWLVMWKDKDGKIQWGKQAYNQGSMALQTIGAVMAWREEAEWKATTKLASLVSEHAMKCYMLTGSFLETSKRSGVTYMFRRLRPTLAMKAGSDGTLRILCALCAHSIGYYADTWAGVLVPTDEVVSHLAFMRGDEPKFWRMCNQHPADMPQSGL